ncbi:alkanesulfonate monooxygenase [Saccharopolyspora antimicrobica]|uniref:Alkanesulfonate monooxygenase n=1 Tax=Saccharopolyspora antimicrobica TaxID=455193 RepID=A0A1I4S8U9_9PSEU|nr:LLM class flavin-dependent oxidoreductase [Saccharopolyspora antimicrobica]RKT87643.1 alkanesulfonate monooxygenase [Saccharopolyspora antimicrobica]SFM60912.1 alkanesulfonate monooxygenase [Saccharopolyspora antimicrobica]
MTVEFIGMIGAQHVSEIHAAAGPPVNPAFLREFARAHEDAGFDRVLIGYGSSSPESTQLAAHAAAHTERLGFLIAHRPGFVAPTLAARTFATADQLTGGRIAVHIITGGDDADQRRDGDYLSKEQRYARTDEYLEILHRVWTAEGPVGHDGAHYRFEDCNATVKPVQQPRIPLYFGGSSEAAHRVGGKHADVFALWGEPLAQTAEQIAAVRAAAEAAGRTEPPRISVSFRPILGATEEQAWDRAHRVLARIRAARGGLASFTGPKTLNPGQQVANVGSQRLLAAAAAGERHDRALWTPTASATNAAGNSTALVGTPETVAAALLDYVDIGVTTLLIRGYDPFEDAVDYGRELIPLVRQELARREVA